MAIGTLIIGATALAGTVGGALLAGAINVAVSFGLGAVVRRMQRRRQAQESNVVGVYGAVRGGGVVPCSFIHGRWATAGSLTYRETWGSEHNTPNAYYVQVIAISDLPVESLDGLIVNGQVATLDLGASAAEQGVPVPEFNVDGKDHLWVRFHDGTQTSADAYLVSKFSGKEDHPYGSNMIGTGIAYLAVTALVNDELFRSFPEVLAVVEGVRLYDVREDSTGGGSGSHRWGTASTHEYGANPLVAAYNILRGIRYAGVNIWGGQRIGAAHLPFSEWAAAMNACDQSVGTASGGTEPQFVAGGEITLDTPPASVIDELMTAAAGRIAESGGVYKPYVGAPGSAIAAFTDDDIVVTEAQEFAPFLDLGESINGISSRYISEEEGWVWKDAPPRTYPAYETEDGGVRNLTGLAYGRVSSPTQVQRLDDAAVKDSRRQRSHLLTLPPAFARYEPGEVLAWTSARNGYGAKLFRIEKGADKDNLDQAVTLRETDPGDYDWDSDDELPWDAGLPAAPRPPAQPLYGWQVLPAVFYDSAGVERRPSIEVRYAGDQEDVRAVQVQVRLAATAALAFDGELPYGASAPGTKSTVLIAVFIGGTLYEARGRLVPIASRSTEWSDWLAVTTPDVDLLDESMRALMRWLRNDVPREIALLYENADRLAEIANTQAAALFERIGRLTEGVGVQYEDNRASIAQEAEVRADADGAMALLIAALEAVAYDPTTGIAANAAGIDLLEISVTAIEGDVESHGLAITALENDLTDAEGAIAANAGAISALETAVSAAEGDIAANAAAIVSVQTAVGSINAEALFSIAAAANQSGASIRIALLGRVNTGSSFVEGGAYFEIVSGTARWLFLASKFIIATAIGGTTLAPFVVDGSTITMNASVVINGSLLVNGTVTTTKIAANAVTQMGVAYSSGDTSMASGEQTIQTVVITRNANSKLDINLWFEPIRQTASQFGGNPPYTFTVRIKRAGSAIHTFEWSLACIDAAGLAGAHEYGGPCVAVFVDENNVSGSQSYTVTIEGHSDGGGTINIGARKRYLRLLEMQR